MPVRYVGRLTSFEGKPLLDYLGRLKDYGIGRVVYRHTFQRYPEPSYYVITRVEPDLTEPVKSGKSRAWGHKVWRGHKLGEKMIKNCYKADWKLVPKDQEGQFTKYDGPPKPRNNVPDDIPMPPLMAYMKRLELERIGQQMTEIPRIKIKIKSGEPFRPIQESQAKALKNMEAS